MYNFRFCTCCNLYKKSVQVAACTINLYRLLCTSCNMYKYRDIGRLTLTLIHPYLEHKHIGRLILTLIYLYLEHEHIGRLTLTLIYPYLEHELGAL